MRATTITSLWFASLALLVGSARPALAADDVQEPFFRGVPQPEHRVFNQGPQEKVDPFSGQLRLVHTDLVLPGHGGLDLKIVRTYSSKLYGRADYTNVNDALVAAKERSPLGLGWQMHQGRLINPWVTGWNDCQLNGQQPVFELPDGTRITFYPAPGSTGTPTNFVSREYWKMNRACGTNLICVTSDQGITYEMDAAPGNTNQYYYGEPLAGGVLVFPAKKIRDAYGNAINVTYYGSSYANYRGAISSISDSYGRTITFSWDSGYNRYTSIYANGYYNYSYTTTNGYTFLTGVSPPAGGGWGYGYNMYGDATTNKYGLTSVTYPQGGTISYSYTGVRFFTGNSTSPMFPVVQYRTVGGTGMPSGTWVYSYSSPSSGDSTTTVSRPGGTDYYTFYGFGSVSAGSVWKVGLPIRITRPSEAEDFSWGASSSVSGAILNAPQYDGAGCPTRYDSAIYAPRMTSHTITRNGVSYATSYGSFDAYGNPGTISESGQSSRSHSLSHWTSSTYNIVRGRPTSDSVTTSFGSYTHGWSYNSYGKKTSETLSGVTTSYSYSTAGDLIYVTDDDGATITYSGYSYGQPTSISYAGVTSLSQGVNWLGLVTSQSGLRNWSFSYDSIGRLISKTPGVGTATGYTHYANSVVASRGSFSETSYFDGFGRPTGTTNSEGVTTATSYNARGCVVSRDFGYGSDSFGVDDLCRVTSISHSGGGSVGIAYGSSTVTVTNERGNSTTYTYKAFGNPDERRLVTVSAGGQTTSYDYNGEGSLKSISGVGGSRTYSYTNNKLMSETNPETGTTTYGRSDIGLMTSRAMGGKTTTYGYDAAHRLTAVNYPGSGDAVSLGYDGMNNVTAMSSTNGGSYTWSYDTAGRVTRQTFSYAGQSYTTSYGYNGLDCVTSIGYPTGTNLTMGCDTLSRTTSISGVVSSASYHESGQLESLSFANGRSVTYGFDGRGRVNSVSSSGLVGLSYTLDGVGNVTAISDSYGTNRSMSYDALDRLTSASGAWGSGSYGYDTHGNRTSKTEGGLATSYNYSSNLLTSATGAEASTFTHDAAGNLTSGNGFTYTWDGANRMATSSDGASYFYNGRGQRVKRVAGGVTTVYHYDKDGNLIAETRDNGKKVRDYVRVQGRLVATKGKRDGY